MSSSGLTGGKGAFTRDVARVFVVIKLTKGNGTIRTTHGSVAT